MLSFYGQGFTALQIKKGEEYLENNKDNLIQVYLPISSPEFMMFEKLWNIAKQELLVLKYYSSFEVFKQKVSICFRTK